MQNNISRELYWDNGYTGPKPHEMTAEAREYFGGEVAQEPPHVETHQSVQEERPSDSLPDSFYKALVHPYSGLLRTYSDPRERDIAALALLTAAGAASVNTSVAYGKRYAPTPFFLVVAPPGSGKGVATLASRLVRLIERRLRAQSVGATRPRTLLIPANSSAAAFALQLEANGGHGLVVETEIDTFVSTKKQEWGDYSAMLRKSAEHEPISVNRKDEQYYIENPRLALIMTGTPGQFSRLFSSAEDGLFSRISPYAYEPQPEWRSQWRQAKNARRERHEDKVAGVLDALHSALQGRDGDLTIVAPREAQLELDSRFCEALESELARGSTTAADATVYRSAVLAVRVMSLLALLRNSEDPERLAAAPELRITPEEASAGVDFALCIADHAIRLLAGIERTIPTTGGSRHAELYVRLPEEYRASELEAIGTSMRIKLRQAQSLNAKLIEEGWVERVERGLYRKAPRS